MNVDDKKAWLLASGVITITSLRSSSIRLMWQPNENHNKYVESRYGATYDEVYENLYNRVMDKLYNITVKIDGLR